MGRVLPHRYLSIDADAPQGFEPCPAPTRRQLRGAVVALWTRDPDALEQQLGPLTQKIAGLILCPGEPQRRAQLGPNLWRVEVSEAAQSVLVEFASAALAQCAVTLGLRNAAGRTQIELERQRKDREMLVDKLDREARALREMLVARTAWTATAMTALVEFVADELEHVDTAALPEAMVAFFCAAPLSFAGAGLWFWIDGQWQLQAEAGRLRVDELPAPGEITGVVQLEVNRLGACVTLSEHGEHRRECLFIVERERPLDEAEASFLSLFSLQLAATYRDRDLNAALSLAVSRKDALIAELSTPLIQVWRDMVCLPVIGSVDDERAARLTEQLLDAVAARNIRYVIVDFTGISTMDTQTVQHFTSLARAIGLLGARCMLTGISPSIARVLVGLGVELGAIETLPSVQSALALRFAR